MKKTKLNIGCGTKTFKDYINVDFVKGKDVDICFNLNKLPWPFKSDSIEEIYADNILEHLDDFDKSLRECHRILKKGGILLIKVPYFSNPGAFTPDHKSFFNLDSLDIYCSNTPHTTNLKRPLFEMVYKKITFLDEYKKSFFLKLWFFLPKMLYRISPVAYIWLFSYLFPASEIHYKLKKI
ncbi:MAG: methyltransferase domain-containing protein [Candidatus Woesearchaeota archaeon]